MSCRSRTHQDRRPATALDLARALKRPASGVGRAAGLEATAPQMPAFLDGLPEIGESYEPRHDATKDLQRIIEENSYGALFQQAIDAVCHQRVPELDRIRTLDQFYYYVDALVAWIPGIRVWDWHGEELHERTVYLRITQFYYYFNQQGLEGLQSPIEPVECRKLTPISAWLRTFALEWGSFLDTPPSSEFLATFKYAPEYNYQDYEKHPEDYGTFNAFFARRFKDIASQRPVAAPDDDRVIVSAADSTYVGQWAVTTATGPGEEPASVPSIVVKHIEWPISELLDDSEYAADFEGGLFTHSFLNTYDYHRLHVPVSGRVLEARFIPGQVYLEVSVKDDGRDENGDLARAVVPERYLDAADGTGYQFVQCRGLLVLDTAIGRVAVLPMGMAQVSSVVFVDPDDPEQGGLCAGDPEELAALVREKWVGRRVTKGDTFSFFQFGGSDVVTVFDRRANVHVTATAGVHYKVRSQVANAGMEILLPLE